MKCKRTTSVGLLRLPETRSAQYLKTLAEWQSLDPSTPLSLTELASLTAHICGQNEAALLKVLGDAVWNEEAEFFGLSHQGHWEPGMLRCLFLPGAGIEKPRVRPPTRDGGVRIRAFIPHPERSNLHYAAVGMTPSEAVRLLKRRGRKIPAELQELLGEAEKAPEPTQEEKDAALLAKFRKLGGEIVGGKFSGRRGALAEFVKEDGRARPTLQPILLRAAARESSTAPFAQMAKQLKK